MLKRLWRDVNFNLNFFQQGPIDSEQVLINRLVDFKECYYLPGISKDQILINAWEVTEALLLKLNREVEMAGARLVIMTTSNPIQVFPSPKLRKKFMDSLYAYTNHKDLRPEKPSGPPSPLASIHHGPTFINNLFFADYRLQDFGVKNQIAVIPLAPTLQQMADQEKIYFHGFKNTAMGIGHWNEEGHKRAAEIVAKKVGPLLDSILDI